MGKPSPPKTPDYRGAAEAQGEANLNSAIATNQLGRIDQVTPQGSIRYEDIGSYTLPDGTVIPRSQAVTTLSPDQQKLYDQNNQISQSLNDLAISGTDYVGKTVNTPYDTSKLAPRVNTLPGSQDYGKQRDEVTNALIARLQPSLNRTEDALRSRLANQGLQAGSEAYNNAYQEFNTGKNDAIMSALLAGGQEQSRMQGLDLNAGNFANTSRQQGIQEQSFFRNDPLNTLNALRTGNQVNMPNFQQTGSANVNAAPIYAATNDQYQGDVQRYQAQLGPWNSLMGGLGSIGAAFAGKG